MATEGRLKKNKMDLKKKVALVFAGTNDHYGRFFHYNNLAMKYSKVIYARDPDKIRGVRDADIYLYIGWRYSRIFSGNTRGDEIVGLIEQFVMYCGCRVMGYEDYITPDEWRRFNKMRERYGGRGEKEEVEFTRYDILDLE